MATPHHRADWALGACNHSQNVRIVSSGAGRGGVGITHALEQAAGERVQQDAVP